MEGHSLLPDEVKQLTRRDLVNILSIIKLLVVDHLLRQDSQSEELLLRVSLLVLHLVDCLADALSVFRIHLLLENIRIVQLVSRHFALVIRQGLSIGGDSDLLALIESGQVRDLEGLLLRTSVHLWLVDLLDVYHSRITTV